MSLRDERGFTITELVVAVGLMSIVMVISLTFLDQATNVSSRAIKDVNTENDARLVLRTITQDLRAAQPSTIDFSGAVSTCPSPSTPGTCIHFTIVRDTAANPGCESDITYGLIGTAIKESRQDYGCVRNITLTGKTVITNLANGTSPLFTYYDKQGNLLTSSQAAAGSVGVLLMVNYQRGAPVLSLSSYASLRNAR